MQNTLNINVYLINDICLYYSYQYNNEYSSFNKFVDHYSINKKIKCIYYLLHTFILLKKAFIIIFWANKNYLFWFLYKKICLMRVNGLTKLVIKNSNKI